MRQTMHRREVIELLAKVRLSTVEGGAMAEFLEDWGQDPQDPEHALPLALTDYYEGVRNGYLSEIYEVLTGKRVEVVGETSALLACPCCFNRTLSERFDSEEGTGYDICRHCGWEDDGTSDSSASSGANGGSMEEYRARLEAEPNFYNRSRWFSDRP
jgi:hypothetical protein